jgi:hypothetical protein
VADLRLHGTPHEQPLERFAREQLTPLGSRPLFRYERVRIRRVASDFSKIIPSLLDRLADAEERKGLEPRIQKMTSMLDSQSKIVNRI